MEITSVVMPVPDYCVSLEDAKSHLRIYESDDDHYVNDVIAAACDYIERYTSRLLRKHEITMKGDVSAYEHVYLPYGSVNIISVKKAGETMVIGTDYKKVGSDLLVFLNSFQDVTIEITSGYNFDNVPASLKRAVKMMIGTMFESRQDVSFGIQSYKMTFNSQILLNPFKLWPK